MRSTNEKNAEFQMKEKEKKKKDDRGVSHPEQMDINMTSP
jgi:hypothetical protein